MAPGTTDLFLPLRSFPAYTLVNHCPCFPPVPEAIFKIIFQGFMFLCVSPNCGCVRLHFFLHLISTNSALSYWVGSSMPLAYACNLPISVIPPHLPCVSNTTLNSPCLALLYLQSMNGTTVTKARIFRLPDSSLSLTALHPLPVKSIPGRNPMNFSCLFFSNPHYLRLSS